MVTISYVKTPYGELLLGVHQGRLCLCDWRYRRMRKQVDARVQKYAQAPYQEGSHDVIAQAKQELEEYWQKKRTRFEVPLTLLGSEFQVDVWQALLQLPYGHTQSYQQLAEDLGNPAAVRAVARANGANALSIFVPCHRIVGSDGALTGYAGGLRVKAKLLALEQAAL